MNCNLPVVDKMANMTGGGGFDLAVDSNYYGDGFDIFGLLSPDSRDDSPAAMFTTSGPAYYVDGGDNSTDESSSGDDYDGYDDDVITPLPWPQRRERILRALARNGQVRIIVHVLHYSSWLLVGRCCDCG